MNKVQTILSYIQHWEKELEYSISWGDEDNTSRTIASWNYAGDLMLYTSKNLVELKPEEAKHFAQWILEMVGERNEADNSGK